MCKTETETETETDKETMTDKSKFCKICKDFGKSEAVFRSHNVREKGKPSCPTLAGLTCRFCKEKGHTPKFCEKLKQRRSRVGERPRNGNYRQGGESQPRRLFAHLGERLHGSCPNAAAEGQQPGRMLPYHAEDEQQWEEVKKGGSQWQRGASQTASAESAAANPISTTFDALASDDEEDKPTSPVPGAARRRAANLRCSAGGITELYPKYPKGRSWADTESDDEEEGGWPVRDDVAQESFEHRAMLRDAAATDAADCGRRRRQWQRHPCPPELGAAPGLIKKM